MYVDYSWLFTMKYKSKPSTCLYEYNRALGWFIPHSFQKKDYSEIIVSLLHLCSDIRGNISLVVRREGTEGLTIPEDTLCIYNQLSKQISFHGRSSLCSVLCLLWNYLRCVEANSDSVLWQKETDRDLIKYAV